MWPCVQGKCIRLLHFPSQPIIQVPLMLIEQGILPSGQMVAVKKLLNAKTMDDRMFHQEVTAMIRVNHQNVVRFLGYCSHMEQKAMKIQGKYILVEERERLLCFEFMSKGSLADYVTGMKWINLLGTTVPFYSIN